MPFSAEELFEHLVENIILQQVVHKRGIPEPLIELSSWKQSADIDRLDDWYKIEKEVAITFAEQLREDWDIDEKTCRYKKEPPIPEVDSNLVDAKLEQLWVFTEPDGTEKFILCKGVVVVVKKRSIVHMEWDKDNLCDGDISITQETSLKSKYNKHVEGA